MKGTDQVPQRTLRQMIRSRYALWHASPQGQQASPPLSDYVRKQPGANSWSQESSGNACIGQNSASVILATRSLEVSSDVTQPVGEKKASNHVDISPERDAPPRSTDRELQRGSPTSWRITPQSAMTLQVLSGVLLVCLGLLLGMTWTIQALQARLRRQAQERRRLNEEWLAIREEWSMIRTTRHQLAKCPRCIGMSTATGSDGDGALGGGPRGAIA
jgi:hypothetical protein